MYSINFFFFNFSISFFFSKNISDLRKKIIIFFIGSMKLLNLQNTIVSQFQHSNINRKYTDNVVLPTRDFLKEMINARRKIGRSDCCSRSRYINFFR